MSTGSCEVEPAVARVLALVNQHQEHLQLLKILKGEKDKDKDGQEKEPRGRR